PYTDANDILSSKTTSLTKVQTRLASDQQALDPRIASLTEVLKAKYNKMDLLVGQLRQSSSNITSIFEAMNAQKNAS
uniref:flagellar filament capping protein FliD n=1 Tax=Pseudomonas viridiflava TaxID=33069 RepID=UPI0013DF4A0D